VVRVNPVRRSLEQMFVELTGSPEERAQESAERAGPVLAEGEQ